MKQDLESEILGYLYGFSKVLFRKSVLLYIKQKKIVYMSWLCCENYIILCLNVNSLWHTHWEHSKMKDIIYY